MLIPHPESDMRLNIMVLGSEIIKYLNSKSHVGRYVLVEKLLSDFLKEDNRRTPDLFIHTLLFLYMIGLIDHRGYKIKLTPQIKKQHTLFD